MPEIGELPAEEETGARTRALGIAHRVGLDRFSGLYIWALIIVVFCLLLPRTFATLENFRLIAGAQAITAMLSLGLLLPVAAGAFDLSCAAMLGFAVTIVVYLQVHGMNAALASLVTVAVGVAVGSINGYVVVRLKVDSFIATLGMSSILAAGAYWVTGGQQIVNGISSHFTAFGQNELFGITLPFYYLIALALIIFVVIEYLPIGRRLLAIGGNAQAARLAGVRVDRVVFGALTASSTIAALVGVILAAQLGSASQDVGTPYLLPAFSAVFLGATQIKPGRVNVLGTIIAIYLLATGVNGLQLDGAPVWVNDLFDGVALIAAVALAARAIRRRRKS